MFDEKQAPLAHECPECGAEVGRRCRNVHVDGWNGYGKPRTRTFIAYVKPHQERVMLAWREELSKA
jgi:hypothetical protein